METQTTNLQRKKAIADPISTALGAADPGSQGVAAPPKNIEVKYQNLPDQKFPGPLSMIAGGIADTASFVANAPFDRSSRAEQNRLGLDSSAEVATEQKRAQAATAQPVQPAKGNPAMGIADMTPDQRYKAADAYRGAVDKATGVSSTGGQGIDGMAKRFDAYAKNDDVRNMRNARDGLLGSGINFEKGADGKLVIANTGKFDPTAGAQGSSINMKEGNDVYARANNIRQQMIDKLTQGGVGILGDGGIAADNAEKTQRWAMDDLKQQLKGARTRSERAVAGQVLTAAMNNQTAQRGQDMNQESAVYGQGIAARGQDIQALSEANRLAGNPVDNSLKQAQATGIAAHTATSKAMAELQQKAINGDATALAQLRSINGKNSDDHARYMPATKKVYNEMGQVVGEDIVPFDRTTGQSVGGSQQGGVKQAEQAGKIKADMQSGKISRDEAIKQLKAMGYK